MHQKIQELEKIKVEKKLTLYRISKDTGINVPTLRNIFTGVHDPRVTFYFKLKDYLCKEQ